MQHSDQDQRFSAWFHFLFVNRTFALVLVLLILVTGGVGYRSMIKESLPDLAIPQALIVTEWLGASPEVVEKEITEPLEQRIKAMKGLRRYRSGSLESVSIIAVEFHASAPSAESMQRLRSKIGQAEAYLPKGTEKPKIEQIAVRDIPIATIALFGDLEDATLGHAAKKLEKRLSRIPGVKKVEVQGHRKAVMRVQLLPERLRALGISPTVIKAKLMEGGKDVPWGKFENTDFPYALKMAGAYRDLDALRELPVVRMAEGRAIRLKEVAQVSRSFEKEHTRTAISWRGADFSKVVSLTLYKLPEHDTIQVIDLAQEAMSEAQQAADWPAGMTYQWVADESELIWDELANSFNNGWQAMLIVFLILFILLSWREALVAALSIPLTFFGTLAILWAVGYTFNVLVIIGMILALGLLVDDFILMMEGMHEGLFVRRERFPKAAWHTMKAYAVPSLSGTLTTILVLIPLAAIGGIDGKFIRIIPLTAAVALTLSYVISLLIAIPLSGLLLNRPRYRMTKTRIDQSTEMVERGLRKFLIRHAIPSKGRAWMLIGLAMGLFGLSVIAAQSLPNVLYPKEDGRNLGITIELPVDSSLDDSAALAERVGQVLRSKPYFVHIVRMVGAKDPYSQSSIGDSLSESLAPHFVGFSGLLTPKQERDKLGFEYVEELGAEIEDRLKGVPGARLTITPEIGGPTAEDPVQIELVGEDITELREISQQVQRLLSGIPGVADVQDNLGQMQTTAALVPRREALDFYHVAESDLAEQVRIYMEDDKVGTFILPGLDADLPIRLGTYWPSRGDRPGGPTDWNEFQQLTIIAEQGQSVPLSALVDRSLDQVSQTIPHKEGLRSVTVKAKTTRATVNDIVAALEPKLRELQRTWPRGYEYRFAGEKEAAEETYANVHKAFVIAVFLVFAILALLFDSFKQPAIILFSVVFGLMGVFFGFYVLELPLSFTAMIGIVALIGINVNDAIVMIDTMNRHRRAGRSVQKAAAQGAADRLRPIVSTTVTTTLGLIPLALSDPGWMPLCAAIICGELMSTVTSLGLIPCLYVLLTSTHYGLFVRKETGVARNGRYSITPLSYAFAEQQDAARRRRDTSPREMQC